MKAPQPPPDELARFWLLFIARATSAAVASQRESGACLRARLAEREMSGLAFEKWRRAAQESLLSENARRVHEPALDHCVSRRTHDSDACERSNGNRKQCSQLTHHTQCENHVRGRNTKFHRIHTRPSNFVNNFFNWMQIEFGL